MKVKNTVPLNNAQLVDYLTDGMSLRIINSTPRADLVTIEPNSMGVISRFPFDLDPHLSSQAGLDDSCIYLPTKVGKILAIDKFSGQILQTLECGNMHIISDIQQDEDFVYCIAAVPLHNGQKFDFDKFAIAICNKSTGQKEIQTAYFSGKPAFLAVDDDLWLVSEATMMIYTKSGELKRTIDLETPPDFDPIITEHYAICVYKSGKIKLFEKEYLNRVTILETVPCVGTPIRWGDNLIWATTKGICLFDYKRKVFESIQTNKNMNPAIALAKDSLILGSTDDGSLLQIDLTSKETEAIKLTTHQLWKPVVVENFVFIASQDSLHQIEV